MTRQILHILVSLLLLLPASLPEGRRTLASNLPLAAFPHQGDTYYVAPNGNDSHAGTTGLPWRTIQHAADTLAAGDTVYIRAGTYAERVVPQNSGSVDNPDAQNVVIRNNIVSQNDYFQILVNPAVPTQTFSIDHNLIDGYRGTEGETYGNDYVEGDPLFVNAPGADFHLQSNSPAIDAGSATGAPNADFDGRLRPLDGDGDGTAAYDIGAYEAWQPIAWIYLPLVTRNQATIHQAVYAPVSLSTPASTVISSSAYTSQVTSQTIAHDMATSSHIRIHDVEVHDADRCEAP